MQVYFFSVIHDLDLNAASGSRLMGHGGADFYAMDAFVQAVGVI